MERNQKIALIPILFGGLLAATAIRPNGAIYVPVDSRPLTPEEGITRNDKELETIINKSGIRYGPMVEMLGIKRTLGKEYEDYSVRVKLNPVYDGRQTSPDLSSLEGISFVLIDLSKRNLELGVERYQLIQAQKYKALE